MKIRRFIKKRRRRAAKKAADAKTVTRCPIHGTHCPGDDGGMFIDGNHPDDMYSVSEMRKR